MKGLSALQKQQKTDASIDEKTKTLEQENAAT